MLYLARYEDAGRPHATIPHAALCEGSEREVVFSSNGVLGAVPGLRALRVSSALRAGEARGALLALPQHCVLQGCALGGGIWWSCV